MYLRSDIKRIDYRFKFMLNRILFILVPDTCRILNSTYLRAVSETTIYLNAI